MATEREKAFAAAMQKSVSETNAKMVKKKKPAAKPTSKSSGSSKK